MNKANNLESFNSVSPLFKDLTDDQANQVSGGFFTYFTDQEPEGNLGNFDNQGDPSFATRIAIPSWGESR